MQKNPVTHPIIAPIALDIAADEIASLRAKVERQQRLIESLLDQYAWPAVILMEEAIREMRGLDKLANDVTGGDHGHADNSRRPDGRETRDVDTGRDRTGDIPHHGNGCISCDGDARAQRASTECPECNGHGYVTVGMRDDSPGSPVSYTKHECERCNGTGEVTHDGL